MNLVGKTIGNRYEILSKAGNGGMATVYKAKDHVLNRIVAIKVLKDEYTTDQDFIKRFNTEAQSAAALAHPNIVSIYDVGHEEDNNLYYIVMELIKGKTLKEIIVDDGTIDWKWAINIAIQIASALEVAHKNGIVHRDIKPHNIIITEDGTAKVTDFGIAKAVSNSTLTSFGTTIGSVHYFSPEQAKGSVVNSQSDLYSLGVVMYEMLTGEVPFDADTPVSVALKHIQDDPKEPIELNEDIPQAVNKIVLKAMQKDPVNRYQTATEMLADLSESLKDPNGDFVIIENKDGGYTRVMQTVKDPKKKKAGIFDKYPKAKIPALIVGAILLFFLIFFATKTFLDGGFKSKTITVPNFVGLTEEEATNFAKTQNLTIEIEEVASNEVEKGKIVSQEPPEGTSNFERKKTIIIKISKGPETTELPNYVGKAEAEADASAEVIGIKFNKTYEHNKDVNAGVVISQGTEAGTIVKSGDTIDLVVSKGVEKVKVPTVVGMNEGTAVATLENAKLKAKVTYTEDTNKDNNVVISQSIEKDKEVEVNAEIEIVINKKPEVKKTKTLNIHITVPKKETPKPKNETAEPSEGDETTTPETPVSTSYKVDIIVNGNTMVDNRTVEGGTTIDQKITGEGKQEIVVKLDGTEWKRQTVDLDTRGDNSDTYIS